MNRHPRSSKRDRWLPLAVAALALVGTTWLGCGAEDTSPTNRSSTRVSLLMSSSGTTSGDFGATDDAGSPGVEPAFETETGARIEAAVVTVTDVYLQSGEDDEQGRVYLRTGSPYTTDLTGLSGEVATLVDGEAIEAGHYNQLRLVITGGYIEVVTDGTHRIFATSDDYTGLPEGARVDGRLHMPSYAQSGLKIDLPAEVAEFEGEQKIVLVEWDVSQSFGHEAGNSGRWIMHPVTEATDIAFTSSVEVEIDAGALDAADALLVANAGLIARLADQRHRTRVAALVDAEGDGTFTGTFYFVNPLNGPYTLDIQSESSLWLDVSPSLPASIDVGSGEVETYRFAVTSVVTATGSAVISLGAAAEDLVNPLVLASLAGDLSDGSGEVVAVAYGQLTSDVTADFVFDGVPAGTYRFDVAAPPGVELSTNPATPIDLVIEESATTEFAIEVTSADAGDFLDPQLP